MAYQALYRKYRPACFSDVYGQEHITETLKSEIESGKTVHAYLFTGTRGTGKTTCAKILSKAVNCLNPKNGDPCGECEMCKAIANDEITDICEIDAASNNGVDDIRTLREQVNFAPSSAKYRVYIIDEVHMLSQSAFNALLKTLEEPPEHVVFILATTEVHKLPATILSRCQRFDFRRIDPEKICERIDYIAEKEGFCISKDAAKLIASVADGGMRDALSVLDLCASVTKEITEETVVSVCAMAGNEYLISLADCIKDKNTEKALLLLDELHNSSVDMLRLLNELSSHYRDLMIAKTVNSNNLPIVCSAKKLKLILEQANRYTLSEILAVLEVLQSTVSKMQSGNHRTEMEMAIIRLCNPKLGNDLNSLEARIAALESKSFVPAANYENDNAEAQPTESDSLNIGSDLSEEDIPLPEPPVEDYQPITQSRSVKEKGIKEGKLTVWEDVIAAIRKTSPLIASVLKDSDAYIEGERLLIDAKNEQFRSLVNSENPGYRETIKKAAFEVLGKKYKLGPYKPKTDADSSDPLTAFSNRLKELEK